MSSKKARRKQRREKQEQEGRQGKRSPVTLFIVGLGVAVLLTIAASLVFVDRSDRGDPPWEGAVWSEAHGHWH